MSRCIGLKSGNLQFFLSLIVNYKKNGLPQYQWRLFLLDRSRHHSNCLCASSIVGLAYKIAFQLILSLCWTQPVNLDPSPETSQPSQTIAIYWYYSLSCSWLSLYERQWHTWGPFIYSKASRYTASRCTDLDNARFWIGSKNISDARFCTFLHVFW